MRVKQLGAILFAEHGDLYVSEDYAPENVLSEMAMSAIGTHIVFEAEILTPYITLTSMDNCWINEEQKAQLEAYWMDLGATLTMTYENDTTETVRMAREKSLVISQLYEGSCFFSVIIPLAKVII